MLLSCFLHSVILSADILHVHSYTWNLDYFSYIVSKTTLKISAENVQCRYAICLTTVSRIFLPRAIIKLPYTFPWKGLQPFKKLVKLIIVQYKSFQHICITIRRLFLKKKKKTKHKPNNHIEFKNMKISPEFSYITESGICFTETLCTTGD